MAILHGTAKDGVEGNSDEIDLDAVFEPSG